MKSRDFVKRTKQTWFPERDAVHHLYMIFEILQVWTPII